MIRKIKTYLIVAVVSLSATSCLDKLPNNAVLEGEAITNVDQAGQAVNGIYAAFRSSNLYSGLLTLLPEIQSDLVYAIDGYSNRYGDFWRWDINPTNTSLSAVYGSLYAVVGRSNFVIEQIEKIEDDVNGDDFATLQAYKGEAHFARALAYSELIKLFCKDYEEATADTDLGVVIVKDYTYDGPITRSTIRESYDFIKEELDIAADLLAYKFDGVDVPLYSTSYFTPYVIEALYARVALYTEDYEEALFRASKVIDSDEYLLSNTNAYSYTTSYNNYEYMWQMDNSTEIIWRVGFLPPNSVGGALGTVFLGYSPGVGYSPDYVPSREILNLYDSSNDNRYLAFFQEIQTNTSHGLTWPLLIKYRGNASYISNFNTYHLNMPKVFRLSEMYLIAAEACARMGDYGNAGNAITELRKARYTSYSSTNVTADNWEDLILEERARELYMEGFRLNDLKRFKKGFTRVEQSNSLSPGDKLSITADNPLFVWPIPQHELDLPNSEIQPNESNL